MSEWQGIETAPQKNGERLLMYGRSITIGYWSDHFGWVDEAEVIADESWPNRFNPFDPDYWMPLPAPPSPHSIDPKKRDKPEGD